MLRLALLLYILIGTTVSGSLIVAALVAGYDTTMPVIYAAAIGFVLAVPVSWGVAKALYNA